MPKNISPACRRLFLRLLLSGMLLALTACTTGIRLAPPEEPITPEVASEEPVAEKTLDAETGAPLAAVPLRGVVITETASLDSGAREDFARAVALLLAADVDGAIQLLEPLVATEPQVTAPYVDLAIAYRKKEQREPAEELLRKALDLVPGHPVASNEYGLLLRSGGRFDEAREIYSRSLESYPDYLPLRRNLGILCDLYLNDMDCALEQYRYYSAARPNDEQAALWVTELQMRHGQ